MLVVVMIYGRTRALPQQVDYALTLAIEIPPSDKSPLQHRSRGVSGGFFTAAAVDRSPVELLLNPGGERDARSDELDSTRARGSWLFSQADLRSLCRSSHASASSSLHSSLHGSFKASSRVSHRLPSLERLLTPRGASRAAASPAIYGSLSAPAAVEAERGAAAAPTAAEAKAAAPSRVREALPRVTERSWWDFSGRSSARPESAASQSEAAGRHSHAARLEPEAAIEEDEEEEEDDDEAPGQAPAAAGGLRHYLSQFTGLGWLRLAASPAAAAVATDAGRGEQQLYDGVGVSGERPGSSKVVTLGDLVNADISDDSSAYSSARGSARQSQTSRELV